VRRDLDVEREPPQRRTPDGSPIEFYKLLPAMGEPELIHSAIPEGASVLDLGCGVGRITHALVELGHRVTAVDESPEMLAEVHGAETVRSKIEDLELGRTFDCVLMMSNLVNNDTRAALLRTCRRHVASNGVVILERMDPAPRWGSSVGEYGPFHIEVELQPDGDSLRGIVVYSLPDGRRWTHRFDPGGRVLDDAAMREELAAAGLHLERIFGPKRRWCLATATPPEVHPSH
jgi:SAM-dependent methyltransferase